MNNEMDFEKLHDLLQGRQFLLLREELTQMNEVDIALFFEELKPEEARIAFRTLPKQIASDVFSNLDSDVQKSIITYITDKELSEIVEDLFMDDVVDMLDEMPANIVKRVLRNATPETRRLINQFLQYPDNSAGSIMTAEYTDLKGSMTITNAIAHIREKGEDRETIYTCYVTDNSRVLEGVVTVKDILLSKDNVKIEDIMDRDVISVKTLDDQEDVAHLFSKYDFLALPVTDHENRLVGVITVDDAIDVIEQEATEDFEVMGGMHPSEKPYLKTGIFTMAKNRIVWLLVLMVSSMITGTILGKFEAAISSMPILVTFIPMLTDTGGNAGSQSSTMIIRGIATGDLSIKNLPMILWKEIRISLLVGVILAAVNFLRIILTYPGQIMVALVVSITLIATVIMAKVVGCVLPLLANSLHIDPAIMAAPLITTIVDAASLVIFFMIAVQILPV